jgi:hypothetical protein
MLSHLIKKYLVWMVLSYIVVAVLVYNFILIPQKSTIEEYRVEKSRIEYNYMKITSSPEFINSLDETIEMAAAQKRNFIWVESENIDAGLTFYNYVYMMTKKANLDLLQVSVLEGQSARRQKEKLYYAWNVKTAGSFPDVLYMISEIEHSKKFLILEDITITEGKADDNKTLYDFIFLGLKGDALDAKKTDG